MKPQKILHIGDLHFTQYKNHEQLKHLTTQLITRLEKDAIDLLYVGGDIVNDFNIISPEQLDLVYNFFTGVSNICPVIVILGNHDWNSNSKNRLDSLTPIIDKIQGKHPIHYLRETGVYNLYNIDWVVWSELDGLTPDLSSSNHYRIGCFHGVVKGSNAYGYSLTNGFEIENFIDCDVVFLNDIHKQQSFRNNEIWYSGSWYQTNWGEANDFNKGGVLWILQDSKYIARPYVLYNPYVLYKHEINSIDSINTDYLRKISIQYPDIRIKLQFKGNRQDFDLKEFKIVKKILGEFTKHPVLEKQDFTTSHSIVKGKIQKNYFDTYFQEKTIQELQDLTDLDLQYSQTLLLSQGNNMTCQIEELIIENFGPFGERQVITPNKYDSLVGVFAPNETGKSFLLDAITFAVFGDTSRAVSKSIYLINKTIQKPAFVSITIKKGDIYYEITRQILLSGKVVLNFTKLEDQPESLNGKDRFKTQTNIEAEFGNYNTFVLNSLYSQRFTEFIDLKQSEKYDYFSTILSLGVYEKKYEAANVDLKNLKHKVNNLVEQQIGFLETNDSLEQSKTDLQTKQVELDKLDTDIQLLKQQIQLFNNEILNINVENINVENIAIQLIDNQTELFGLQNKQKQIIIPEEQKQIDISEEEYKIKFELEQKINNLKSTKLGLVCNTCNRKFEGLEIDEAELDAELIILQNKLGAQIKSINKTTEDNAKVILNNKLRTSNTTLLNKLSNDINIVQNNIIELQNKKVKAEQNLETLKTKQRKTEILRLRQEELKQLEENLKTLNKQLIDLQNTVVVLETKQTDFLLREADIKTKQKQLSVLEVYVKSMHRKGIRRLIIEDTLIYVNELCNKLINSSFDFNIEFVIDDKDEIHVLYFDDTNQEQSATQCSGMERFIITLSIKNALNQISLLNKLDLFMIDEGFGVLDTDNLDLVINFIKQLTTYYHKTIIITHVDYLKNCVDNALFLEKTNGETKFI